MDNLLAWLDAHGKQVIFQDVPHYRRPKNRVLVEFVGQDGQSRVVGGSTLAGAILKAQSRHSCERRADGQLSGAHLEA